MEYTCLECKQNVGARMDSFMSTSDGSRLSIFCRKMEKARRMREEMDGKVVFVTAESAFLTLMFQFIKYFCLIVP